MKDLPFQELLERMDALHSDQVVVERGEILFRQGDPGDSFFVVKTGRLRVIYNLGLPNEHVVGEVGPGEPVGELALLWSSQRSATVMAIRFTVLARLSKDEFDRLIHEYPAEAMQLMRVVAWRLKQSYEIAPRRSLPANIAVIPAGAGVPLANFCARLGDTLPPGAREGRVLQSSDVPAEINAQDYPPGSARDPRQHHALARWLGEQCDRAELNILQTDFEVTPWTLRCLHQADLVLLLGRAGDDPTPGPIEAAFRELAPSDALPRMDLVLLQRNPPPYHSTGEWLRPRQITRHYHVRLDSKEDELRAGRLLSGSDVSLVLGGGGARGLGHIGVFRACQEVGLPIDRVVGVSLGSVIAGLIAQGRNWQEVAEIMRRQTSESGRLTNYTVPLISIDTGRRYFARLDEMFGDTQIEDLPLNYFCVSCSLSRARVLVHRSGPLAKWIGASSSVPGIAPPLVEAGELIVDGGVLNNLPIDLVRAEGAGRVIAVDVSPEVDLLMPPDYFGRPRPFEMLWAWCRAHFAPQPNGDRHYPSIISLLFRASTLSSIPATVELRKRADLLISLPLARFRFFDWEKISDIIEVGRREALSKLPDFLRLTKNSDGSAPPP